MGNIEWAWACMLFLMAVDTALKLVEIRFLLKKDQAQASADTKAALDLAHQVAADAMMHLKSQNSMQFVQAQATQKASEVSLETEKWMAERQRKEIEQEEARRAEREPTFLKTADGKVVDFADFENAG